MQLFWTSIAKQVIRDNLIFTTSFEFRAPVESAYGYTDK